MRKGKININYWCHWSALYYGGRGWCDKKQGERLKQVKKRSEKDWLV